MTRRHKKPHTAQPPDADEVRQALDALLRLVARDVVQQLRREQGTSARRHARPARRQGPRQRQTSSRNR